MVPACLEVVIHIQRTPYTRHVVIVLSDTHGYAPELTTAVVLVEQQSVPAVGIDIETTLGVDVALTILEGGFNHVHPVQFPAGDRKSTRLNSSHVRISYAVFCLKKKK